MLSKSVGAMSALSSLERILIAGVRVIVGAAIFVSIAINFANIAGRYLFSTPVIWAEEILVLSDGLVGIPRRGARDLGRPAHQDGSDIGEDPVAGEKILNAITVARIRRGVRVHGRPVVDGRRAWHGR